MNIITSAKPRLPVYYFQIEFTLTSPLQIPRYPGSAWRGALGHALKRTVCVVRNTACNDCLLKNNCAYTYIFETPPPPNSSKMRKYTAAPHPFVLQFQPQSLSTTHHYRLGLTLFGKGHHYLPYLIHALKKAGLDGIGAHRQVFELHHVKQLSQTGDSKIVYQHDQLAPLMTESDITIPPMPDNITLNIHTPMRIKHKNHYLTPQTFNFSGFFSNLIRRISMLMFFHTDTQLETDFTGLTQHAKNLDFKNRDLHWFDWQRYSSRQKTRMNMGGVIGTLELDMQNKEAFWPYLWLGQWVHVGKATSMGLGHYSIDMTSLSTP